MTHEGKFARLGIKGGNPVAGRSYDPERVAANRAALNAAVKLGRTYSPGNGDKPQDVLPHTRIETTSSVERNKQSILFSKLSTEAPRIPWDYFIERKLEWNRGEHFGFIGPTGQGKTTMLLNLLPLRQYVTVFATKPRDETMQALVNSGYLKIEHWRSLDADYYPKRVLWPDASRIDSELKQREVFKQAFAKIYREGSWTVCIDELWFMWEVLKLKQEIKIYYQQSRALGISLMAASQRPAWIPVEMYDQSTHLMFWRDNDETNLRRISGIGWKSSKLIMEIVSNLDPHQVLYINTRTGEMCRTRCPMVRI